MTHNQYVGRIIRDAERLAGLPRKELLAALAEECDEGGWDSPAQAKRERKKILDRLKSEYQLWAPAALVGLILSERYLVADDRDVPIDLPSIDPPVA